MAQLATPGLIKELERRDTLRSRHEAQTSDEAQAISTRLEATELRFDVKAGPTGSLFGSVTATNVADKLWDEMKIRIDRRKLDVGTIKRIGRYTIPVEVFGDVTAELRLLVVPEGGELPPDEEIAAADAAEAEAAAAATDAPAATPGDEPAGPEPDAEPEAEVELEAEPEDEAADEAVAEDEPEAEAEPQPAAEVEPAADEEDEETAP